jgi:nucleotide-binding universal stress UspA family protein
LIRLQAIKFMVNMPAEDENKQKGDCIMSKKFLIAVDDSIHSKSAIKYACNISASVKEASYTLLHIQPMISQYLLDEARQDFAAEAELKKVIKKNSEAGESLLEKYKKQMVRLGVAEQHIDSITVPRALGLAKDILKYSSSDIYDAIIIGRRGLSGLQEAIMGSVSANIVEHSDSTPIWLIDGEVVSTKIMFAVDGSENSLKALDHLSLMLGDDPDARILFFHVQPKISDYCPIDFEMTDTERLEEMIVKGDKKCIDQFFAHARKKLKDAGFDDNQIEVKVSDTLRNPGKAIIEEAKNGDYGTIVIGRRGINKTFFTGSVSHYVINKISDKAVWIVP